MSGSLARKLDDWFAVDLRSLAAFRVALASVLLYDLIDRARDLSAHYTDAGIVPSDVLEQIAGSGIRFSLHHHLSGSEWAVGGLFVLSWLAATALLFGHRTRLSTAICWLLLASLQVRNPYLASMGGDALLRVLLTWALLLPLGARWSLDALRDPSLFEHPNRLRSIPSAALLVQVCLVYWVTGIKKDGPTWQEGTAVYYALHLDYWVTPIGVAVREQAGLLPFFTHATRWFELLGPFLAFSPFLTAPLRLLTIALFAGFHLSLALCLSIGMFPLVSMVGWLAFVPTSFWDRMLPSSADAQDLELEDDAEYEDEEDEEEYEEDEDEEEEDDEAWDERAPRSLAPWWAQLAGLGLLLYILAALATQVGLAELRIPGPVSRIAAALRIQQHWSMFSPDPPPMDFWPVVSGSLADGRSIDLFSGAEASLDKPTDVSATLPSFRWRLYFSQLTTIRPDDRRYVPTYVGLTRHLCTSWNSTHSPELQIFDVRVSLVVEFTRETHEDDPRSATLYEITCADAQNLPDYSSRWTLPGEKAGRHTAMYSAPPSFGLL